MTMHSSRGSSSRRPLALGVLAVAVLLSACAGENLFQIAALAGGGGPTVDITAPSPDLTLAQGAAVQITGTASAPNGLSAADYSGVFTESGEAAFVADTETFENPSSANLDKTLIAVVPTAAGEVWIIVKVTDGLGEAKADTVTISIS